MGGSVAPYPVAPEEGRKGSGKGRRKRSNGGGGGVLGGFGLGFLKTSSRAKERV